MFDRLLEGRENRQVTNRFDTDSNTFSHLPENNLPAQTTSFIGREHELNELKALIEDTSLRLITVIAPGGMGKTRLAIEAGNQALHHLGMSTYLIELAPLTDATSIVSAIADALKYNFQNDERSPKQQILDYLANKIFLFIFDNYEHIIESASLVTDILTVSPHIQILATSRRPLKQQGETLFHLAGMDFPNSVSLDDAINYAAIKLFVNSAKRVVSDFALDPQNLSDVILICRMVQGMPLGIVLAASWIGILSTGEIVEEMEESINFLETDEANLPDRQRSMRAVMNYTWQMMSEAEQEIFMQASIFMGGFTREAIQSVTSASLRNLMSLANKSILHRNADTGRYTIHEMLRQYALEHLIQSGNAAQAHQRHMTYYANLMSAYEKQFRGGGQLISAMRVFERDIENIQVAWKYATDTADFTMIDELLSGLFHFYDMRGWIVEGEQQFGRVAQVVRQEANKDNSVLLGKLIARQAKFLFYHGEHQKALQSMGESVQLLENTGNDDELAATLNIYADALSYMGDFENSCKLCERSLVILQKTNDRWGIASTLNNLGVAYYYLRDYDNAISHYEKSMAISRDIGDISGVTAILSNLGAIAHDQGFYDRATELYIESMSLSEMLHDQYGVASIQLNLGWTLFVTQKYQEAYRYTVQSIETAKRLGNRWLLTTAHINIGAITCELGDLETAKQHLAIAYQEIQQLEANHLLPDIIAGVGSLLIKYQIYDQAYNLLHYGGQLPGLEHETKARINDLMQTAEVILQGKKLANESKIVDNNNIENILSNILL